MTTTLTTNRLLKLAVLAAVIASLLAVSNVVRDANPAGAVTNSTVMCTAPSGGNGTEAVPRMFNLSTATGYAQMPDGNSIFMWSYMTTGGTFQTPGPTICVDEGEWVQINLTNDLDVNTSVSFPGQIGVTTSSTIDGLLANETAPGTTESYTFQASEPGTYLYESGTDPIRQVQMGLYGAIIVRPVIANGFGPDHAYNDASTQFDPAYEYLLLIHEVDPVLHQLEEAGNGAAWDPNTRHNRYWTINGRSFPDVIAPNEAPWLPNQPYGGLVQVEAGMAVPALVRYANAGLDNHPFHPHGNHLTFIGQDGRSLGAGENEAFSKTLGAGTTYELLAEWQDTDPWVSDEELVPVVIPGLEDVVFKDGVTWYSGSPELGETGPLPGGHTTFTECGEYYFPWHSHALNEVQNFDEGFGGMLTLWRVDPPGGCQ